jgi:hypothetical protein
MPMLSSQPKPFLLFWPHIPHYQKAFLIRKLPDQGDTAVPKEDATMKEEFLFVLLSPDNAIKRKRSQSTLIRKL